MSIFGNRSPHDQLDPPPVAKEPGSIEILRLWASEGGPQQIVLRKKWDDPAAWGIALVDIARHVANAYANEGYDRDKAFERIKMLFDAEWESPTSPAEDLTPK